MVRKAELIVEQFDNGFSLLWRDLEGEVKDSKSVALLGGEKEAVGELLFEDILEYFDKGVSDKVKITIKYEAV